MTKRTRKSRYSPEVRERAVRLVQEHQPEHGSQWAAICSIAEKIGCTSETLRYWVRQAERDGGLQSGVTTDDRQRIRELERENPLRIDEAQGLRRCDIELENGRPKRARIVEYPGHTLKSPGAARTVGFTEDVIPMIAQRLHAPGGPTDMLWPDRLRDYWKAHYAFEKICILAGLHDEGKHHLSRVERDLDRQLADKLITEKGKAVLLQQAKERVPRSRLKALYTMHALRHTLATRLADDGMPLNDLRLLLGQSDIKTTMRYIGKKLTKEKAQRAASRSGRVMPFVPMTQ